MNKNILHFLAIICTRHIGRAIVALAILSGASKTGLVAQTTRVFSTSGTFTVPACVTSITVQCWGAGGGGGGASEASGGATGAGGGGGGFATATLNNVSGTFTVTVGAGGPGGIGTSSMGPNGTAGGNSSVTNGTITVTAVGGAGGAGQSAAGNASGVGMGGGGTFVGVAGSMYKGGNGAVGNNQDDNTGGAGGGGAGNAGDGVTPSATQDDANGTGGAGGAGNPNTAQYQGGVGGSVTAHYYENGGNGSTIGGGGAGGGGETSGGVFGHGTSPGSGGSGGDGQVIITYSPSLPTITSVTGSGCVGSTVIINGTLLAGATSVTIGSAAVTNLTITASVITGTVAPGTSTGTVTVIDPCGTATSATPFTVYSLPLVNLGTQSLCSGSYNFGGRTYTTAGTYSDTANSVHGCDSITTVTLTGGAVIYQAISQNLCNGATYNFGGQTISSTGVYKDTTLSTVTGCDSITTLTIAITQVLSYTMAQSICAGDTYSFNGGLYAINGTFADTLIGAGTNGCDSIVILNLTVNQLPGATLNDSICPGQGYNFNGHTYTGAGVYADTLPGAGTNGCDSTVTLTLFVRSGISTDSLAITSDKNIMCSGDSAHLCATPGFAHYLWNVGDTTVCISSTLGYTYEVTATDNGGCSAVSNQDTVAIYPQTAIVLTVSSDTLRAFGGLNYQWYYGDSMTLLPGDTNAVLVATVSGKYFLAETDSNGCLVLSTGQNITVTGIEPIAQMGSISVYPNPLQSGNWQLQVSAEWIGSRCELFDATGKTIYKSQIKNLKSEIELNVAPGIYLMKVYSDHDNSSFKLVKL